MLGRELCKSDVLQRAGCVATHRGGRVPDGTRASTQPVGSVDQDQERPIPASRIRIPYPARIMKESE